MCWTLLLLLVMTAQPGYGHGRGLFATQAEAEERAAELNCTGVHQNNGRWMPCRDEADLHGAMRRE